MFLTESKKTKKKNKRIDEFDDSEPWCGEDIKQILASEIGAEIKVKITAKFRASRRLRFEVTKRIMSPQLRQKCLRN